jgi:hypothetical protein
MAVVKEELVRAAFLFPHGDSLQRVIVPVTISVLTA